MKLLLIIILCIITQSIFAQKQDAKNILKKSMLKCAKIQNGCYKFQSFMISYSKDTTEKEATVTFEKKDAEISALKLESKNSINFASDKLGSFQLFFGDSSYIFADTNVWKGNSDDLFLAYMQPKKVFFSKDILTDTSYKISYESEKIINAQKCHYIKFSIPDIVVSGQTFSSIHFYYGIDKISLLPIQYETAITFMGNVQYTRLLVTKSDFNQKKYSKELADFQPQPYFKEKNNIPFTQVRALEIGDTLPDFAFQNLPNYNINFANLQQDYILLDFWYTGCFPCILALPFVDSLAKTYENKNLFVLGVNPYDTSASKMSEFKKKKNINYSNILIDIKTADAMRIVGYPTLAIIDRKTRKVLYVQRGYSEEMKQPLIDFIEKMW